MWLVPPQCQLRIYVEPLILFTVFYFKTKIIQVPGIMNYSDLHIGNYYSTANAVRIQ